MEVSYFALTLGHLTHLLLFVPPQGIGDVYYVRGRISSTRICLSFRSDPRVFDPLFFLILPPKFESILLVGDGLTGLPWLNLFIIINNYYLSPFKINTI